MPPPHDLRDPSHPGPQQVTPVTVDDVNDQIHILAASVADRIGDNALDVVMDQFDAAEGDAKLVWGRIMEWLLLHREKQGARQAE